jgi:hypothetical protein
MRIAVVSGVSPKRILATWDSEEITWLLAFATVHPFGDDWRQTGRLCSVIAAGHGVRTPEESYMPIAPPDDREQRRLFDQI